MVIVVAPNITDIAMDRMDGSFVWGQSDCCTCVCDIFAALHGVDPMTPLRGRYNSQFGAYRQIKMWGGWVRMFTELAKRSGLTLAGDRHGAGWLGLADLGDDCAMVIGIEDGLWAGKIEGGMQTTKRVIISCHS